MTDRAAPRPLRLVALLACCALLCRGLPARAAPAQSLCPTAGTDDALRPIPQALVPTAVKIFGLKTMPAEQVERSTFFRCFAGQVLLCTAGANLPCGKANSRRHSPGATAWCANHPNADFIPAYVTGHDTIYSWRCEGHRAAIAGQSLVLDPRGFIAEFWKAADPISRQ